MTWVSLYPSRQLRNSCNNYRDFRQASQSRSALISVSVESNQSKSETDFRACNPNKPRSRDRKRVFSVWPELRCEWGGNQTVEKSHIRDLWHLAATRADSRIRLFTRDRKPGEIPRRQTRACSGIARFRSYHVGGNTYHDRVGFMKPSVPHCLPPDRSECRLLYACSLVDRSKSSVVVHRLCRIMSLCR